MSREKVMWDRIITCYQKDLPAPEDIDLVVVDNDVVSFYKNNKKIEAHDPAGLLFDLLGLIGYRGVVDA